MDGSQCLCWAVRQRRDLAAILGPGSLGGGQRVARRDHAAPRRDRNDGDVAPPLVGARRVGRGDRLGGGHGGGAVTSDGAARSSKRIRLRTPQFLLAPRPRYPQERKILSLMILIPIFFLGGLLRQYIRGTAAVSCGPSLCDAMVIRRRREGGLLL